MKTKILKKGLISEGNARGLPTSLAAVSKSITAWRKRFRDCFHLTPALSLPHNIWKFVTGKTWSETPTYENKSRYYGWGLFLRTDAEDTDEEGECPYCRELFSADKHGQ